MACHGDVRTSVGGVVVGGGGIFFRLQEHLLRAISSAKCNAHTDLLFKSLTHLKIEQTRKVILLVGSNHLTV